jgi:hypothetical protein
MLYILSNNTTIIEVDMTEEEKISLKEYVDMRFDEIKYNVTTTAQQLDKRLDSMNEFREQLNTQTRTFISRPEHDALVDRVNKNEQKISNFDGRAYALGIFITFISVGVSIALHFIH